MEPRAPGEDRAPEDRRGPGGKGACSEGDLEEMGHSEGDLEGRGGRRRRGMQGEHRTQGSTAPGGYRAATPLPGLGATSAAGGASRGSHRFGFLLGGEVVVESLGVLPGPPRRARCPGGARRLHGAAAPCAPGAAGGALYNRAARGAPGSNPPG